MSSESAQWQVCNSCKQTIEFSQTYWICNVSTCNRKPTNMVFCKVACWDAHVPLMRHRDAWAVEKRAPSKLQWAQEQAAEQENQNQRQRRRRIAPPANLAHSRAEGESVPLDILIVASKLKAYIRARSGMNTSSDVMAELSNRVRDLCNEAIRNAAMDERKTVLDRDIPKLIRRGSDSYGYD